MLYLLIALIILGIITAGIALLHNKQGDDDVIMKDSGSCATCDGVNTKCEQECMMEAATKEIEYFDDEDLDSFAGRSSSEYSDDEAEQFREVLYTMKQDEVKDWTRSLTLRNISLPDQIKDEVFMLIE
jgi:U3 small nucleolar ribonucleoprotein component